MRPGTEGDLPVEPDALLPQLVLVVSLPLVADPPVPRRDLFEDVSRLLVVPVAAQRRAQELPAAQLLLGVERDLGAEELLQRFGFTSSASAIDQPPWRNG